MLIKMLQSILKKTEQRRFKMLQSILRKKNERRRLNSNPQIRKAVTQSATACRIIRSSPRTPSRSTCAISATNSSKGPTRWTIISTRTTRKTTRINFAISAPNFSTSDSSEGTSNFTSIPSPFAPSAIKRFTTGKISNVTWWSTPRNVPMPAPYAISGSLSRAA
uniref:(northern house mosquito) hypothetical protein n=1 Tax=Culex pipiens TaxID=7175 RepID=A0A8D8F1C7_CULPI